MLDYSDPYYADDVPVCPTCHTTAQQVTEGQDEFRCTNQYCSQVKTFTFDHSEEFDTPTCGM